MKLKFRVILQLILLISISFSLFAGGQGESVQADMQAAAMGESVYPLTVVDDLGNSVVLQAEPRSIASLTLFTDEVLMDLTGPDRLSVLTSLSADPVYSNIADRADQVGTKLDLNVEKLIEIYPDLIFAANWSDPGKIEQLRQAGIKVYIVNTPFTLKGIEDDITKLGAMLNAEDQASAMVEGMKTRLADLKKILDDGFGSGAAVPLSGIDYNSWGTSSGKDSSWQAILDAAGIVNSVADLTADEYGQIPVSREYLVELDPDILFLPGFIWGDPDGAQAFADDVAGDPALGSVTAVREGRLFMVPEHFKSTYSQYIVDSAYFIAQKAYPQLFR